ncbi:hypothetical protein ACROYT_G002258 [Oculina patagonica]
MKNVLLFVTAALFCIGYPASSTGSSEYVKVGCFKDKLRQRALPELLVSYRGKIDWNNLNQIVENCAREAKKKNYMYFGIQFYGECWSGATAPGTYDRYGRSTQCTTTVGKAGTNLVYRLVGDEKECLNYLPLSEANRSATFHSPNTGSLSCDRNGLSHGWYRFQVRAGNQMASTCSASTGMEVAANIIKTSKFETAAGSLCTSWQRRFRVQCVFVEHLLTKV